MHTDPGKPENRRVDPLYYPAEVRLRLVSESGQPTVIAVTGADPRRWAPRELQQEEYTIILPTDILAGPYELELTILDQASGRVIELALAETLRTTDGHYRIGQIFVE